MANSFLQRLFAKKKRHSDAKSLSFKQQNRNPLESPDVDQNAETKEKVNALFAFVDLKDPFTPSEIACEELPGPILSILSAKQFDSIFLFYTPQTHENAVATKVEIEGRHKGCRVRLQPSYLHGHSALSRASFRQSGGKGLLSDRTLIPDKVLSIYLCDVPPASRSIAS